MKYERILRYVMETPWSILPSKLDAIVAFLELQASGAKLSIEEIKQAIGPGRRPDEPKTGDSIAIVPLRGVIAHRMDSLEEISGGTSVERLTSQLRRFVNDDSIKAIVLDVDSPGGSTAGVQEAAEEILKAREVKPIVAVANTLMASAAYHLGAMASEVVASPSGYVGSIGTMLLHFDESKALDKYGLKISIVHAGKYKAEANPYEPLSEDGREHLQAIVDAANDAFVKNVARGRDVSVKDVRSNFGGGRMFEAKRALEIGMIDRVATLEETISRLAGRGKQVSVIHAHSDNLDSTGEKFTQTQEVTPVQEDPDPAPEPTVEQVPDSDLMELELEHLEMARRGNS